MLFIDTTYFVLTVRLPSPLSIGNDYDFILKCLYTTKLSLLETNKCCFISGAVICEFMNTLQVEALNFSIRRLINYKRIQEGIYTQILATKDHKCYSNIEKKSETRTFLPTYLH